MIRLSVSNYSFEAIPLDGTLAIARAMGFNVVDIGGFHARGRCNFEPDDVGADPEKQAAILNPLLKKHQLVAGDFFVQFGADPVERSMNDPDPAVHRHNLASFPGIVRFCQLIGAHGITILPGVDHPQRSLAENLDASASMLPNFVKLAHDGGLALLFEPHMGSVTVTPERAIDLCQRVPGIKVALDYTHFLVQYIPVDRVHKLIPYAGLVHVRQARPGKLQTRDIEGTLDYVDIVQRLKVASYDGFLSLEYVSSDWYDGRQIDILSETMATKAVLEPYVSL